MLKKIKKSTRDFNRAVDEILFPHLVVDRMPGGAQDTPTSHKRNLSLGSNDSGDKSAPLNKKIDDKKTPVKMSSGNVKGPGKGSGSGKGKATQAPQAGPSGKNGPAGQPTPSAAASGSTVNNVPSLDKDAIMLLPTYAQKAAEGDKVNKGDQFPWALYAFGEDGKSPISGRTFWFFQRYINEKWCKLSKVEKKWIRIEFYDYSDTFGVIAALDRYTGEWIKNEAKHWAPDEGPIEGLQKIKCFNRWERTETAVYKTFLRGPNWRREKSGSQFLMTCLEEAGLGGYTFTNMKWEAKPRGTFLAFEPEPNLADELDKTMLLHYYGVCIRLKKQIRKAVTEAEWMAQLGYEERLLGVDDAAKAEEEKLLASDVEDDDEEMT